MMSVSCLKKKDRCAELEMKMIQRIQVLETQRTGVHCEYANTPETRSFRLYSYYMNRSKTRNVIRFSVPRKVIAY